MSVFEKHVYVPADLLQALGDHTGHFWSSPALDPIICDAIRAWMKPAPAVPPQPAAPSGAGYQWKQLFLPDGTRLRASFGGRPYFAVVAGAQIAYGKQSISPSGFANLRGSGNRNAWKAIWLRLPGSDDWLLADVCRSARKTAIARMFGDAAPAAKPRARSKVTPRLRQGQDHGKPPASRRTRASGMKEGGRAAVAVRPVAPALGRQTKARPSGTPGVAPGTALADAAPDDATRRNDGTGPAARRKRRAKKHAPARP